MNNPPRPVSVTIAYVFISLGALTWLALGALLALNAHTGCPDEPPVRDLMAGLSAAAGLALLVLLYLLSRRWRPAFFLTLSALTAASLSPLLDDVGLADCAFMAVTLVPLILLLRDRYWYLRG
jgi:hypothetical protein